jgi:hypothetical protein
LFFRKVSNFWPWILRKVAAFGIDIYSFISVSLSRDCLVNTSSTNLYQNLIERNNLETDESRDNQNDAERVLGEDRNNGIDENENACKMFVKCL